LKFKDSEIKWINTDGGDPKFREKVIRINKKHSVDLVVLEPGVFDHGVKRVGHKRDGYVVVYDVNKLAESLAEDYLKWNDSEENKNRINDYDFDAAYSDAIEWIDFNTHRSLPYMGRYAPKLVIDNENGREMRY